jgi:hypothetical protein
MSARTDLVERLALLVGADALTIEDRQDGWPALATVRNGADVPIALFVSPVGLSHRDRDNVERRFQNPSGSKPLEPAPGRKPVLVGVWESDPLVPVPHPMVLTADPLRRAGRQTRWSVFAPLAMLIEAQASGWATSVSDSGEPIRCLLPPLLPAAIQAEMAGVEPVEALVRTATGAAGLLDHPAGDDPAADRARRAVTALVRDARFSSRVLDAYDHLCAMCGLGLSLVQGAHIYPASAPGSPDEPWNGLALCANHHLAFDRHLVAVEPDSSRILFDAEVLDRAAVDPPAAALVAVTREELAAAAEGAAPRPEMFRRRYAHYPGRYTWL